MPKYKRVLVPAVLAAGCMLLTACASAADGKQNTSTTASSTSASAPDDEDTAGRMIEGEDDPLGYSHKAPDGDCGQFDLDDGRAARLISDEGSLGFISCDDAANVFVDFDMLDDQVEIPAEGLNFNEDWHCDTTVDAGVTVGVECFTPMFPDPANPILLRFHTELM